jgi:iron complex outermembrane receptor protein
MHSDGYKERASNDGQSVLLSTGLFKKKHVLKFTVLAGRQQNGLAWLGVSMDDINQNPRTNANGVEEKDQFLQTFEVLQHIWQLKKGFLKTSVYHSYVDGNYNFDFNAFLRMPSDSILYNYAFRSHLVGAYSYYQLETKRLQWSVGVHGNTYTRRHIGSMRDGAWFDLYENHGTKSEVSGFTRAMYKLGKLGIYGDVQVRNAMFAYDGSVPFEARQWLFVNPRAGVSYAFSKLLDVYASYGSTGREPTRNNIFGGNDDLLADDNGQPLTFITDPEYVQNGEAGIRMKGKNWRANLNGFLMRFRNEIVLNGQFGPNALPLGSGVDLSRRAGIELDASYSFTPKLTVSHASSYMQSVIEEGNVTFSPILAPRFIAFQEATYTSGKWSAAVSARYQSASFIDLGNTFTLAPYWLFNARAAVQVGKVGLGLHLNNLGNKQYFNNAAIEYDVNGNPKPYYFVQAPFHVHGTVTYTF